VEAISHADSPEGWCARAATSSAACSPARYAYLEDRVLLNGSKTVVFEH
jgi:formyltetrahydrofolate hydrolase